MKTFNKRGDKGDTSLCYGERVAKNSPRPEAYGTVDEAVSALGLARALCEKPQVRDIVLSLQQDLFILCAELATAPDHYDKLKGQNWAVTAEMVDRLEKLIDDFEQELEMPKMFIVPGASPGSAALHLARTLLRRAERRAVGLQRENLITNENVLAYLNRASDLVFTLARYEEAK
jgi:cob(I)alamin adenosyltransferase